MYYKDIALTGPQAAIGYEDENLPTRVIIDISDLTKYGTGTTVLEVKRPCDREAYIAEQTEVDGNNFYWYPTKGDLEVSGLLKCQVKAVIGDQIVKTRVYSVQVSGALNGDGTLSGVVPDALQTFVESASGSEDAAKASAEEAKKASETAASSAASIKASADQIAANKKALQTPTTVTDPTSKTVLLAGSQGIDYSKLADAIIAKYTGQTLAGKAQAVKTALDLVKNQTDGIIDVVNGTTTKDYASGDFFQLNNKTYVARTAIVSGTALTDSTVTSYATALSESALNSLSNSIAGINETLANLNSNSAGAHNAIFRGKNLGSSVTSAQSTAIQNGTFKDLYVGDYWSINGVNYRIAGCDLYLHYGDSGDLGHQLAIVPDTCLLNGNGKDTHFMNDTGITTGGYVGSKMYTTTIPSNDITGKIKAAFGSHLYSHREYLCNAVTNGIPSGGSWYGSAILLMNEVQVYGSVVNGNLNGDGSGLFNIGIGNSQLPLFRLAPQFIHTNQNYWLRDVVSASWFACVSISGNADRGSASGAWLGVRPLFLIH